MIRLISRFLFLLILSSVTLSANENTFSERLSKVDIPDKFQLEEIMIGNKNAKIHLIIYSSFTCPYCREFHRNELKKFIKEYVNTGIVKVSLRCYLDDQGAMEAAQITRCLCDGSLDKYMRLYNAVYEQQIDWLKSKDPAEFLKNIFVKLGFSRRKIEDSLKRTDIGAGLMLEQKRAMHQLGLFSMPAFIVKDRVHVGKIEYEQLKDLCGCGK